MYFDLELRILETCTGYADVIGHITLLTRDQLGGLV